MKKLIVANWKMNPQTLKEATVLLESIKGGTRKICPENPTAEVVICPPFVYLPVLSELLIEGLSLGGQDVFYEEKGAFTGEISPLMLKNMGCGYVIIGHSERRKNQKEDDKTINKKITACLKQGLKIILCVDKTSQVRNGLKGVSGNDLENIIIAYEPLFAIGTGKACGTEQAKKMKESIVREIKAKIPVLYGGSVDSQNAEAYVKEAGFDGLLVGGASLKADEFNKIIEKLI
jgi:triosephosphate isomerase (TIM)